MNGLKSKYGLIEFVCRKSAWKLQYLIEINGSRIPAEQLRDVDLDAVSKVISNVKGTTGYRYTVLKSFSGYFAYEKHYSVLVNKKVTESARKLFEQRLLLAWQQLKPGVYLA